jgi:uncharacterized NAD(P)/FAD-binding protein YdhS
MEHRVCIIGGGPRATYLLQHLLAAWQTKPLQTQLRISIVEPVEFGAGATYRTSQPDFLRLNTVISQVTAYPDETVEGSLSGLRGPTFFEWYGPHNGMSADGYPSRRDTGRYLAAVFGELLERAPAGMTIECRSTAAVDMWRTRPDEWNIQLADGQAIRCDAVVLAIGMAASAKTDSAILANEFGIPLSIAAERFIARPYPVERTLARLQPGETVGVLGLGLTALDIIRACTVGRGGKFQREQGAIRYISSGAEPRIVAWSRTGLPLMARGVNQKPVDQKVQGRFLTEEAVDRLRTQRLRATGTPKLDFAQDLLPLLIQEMAAAHNAALAACPAQRASFRWRRLVCPLLSKALRSAETFKAFFVDYLRRDVAEALRGNLTSPEKSACDVIRDLRDKLRYAVEFGGLSPESHQFFDAEFTPIHNRLAVGPPVEVLEELLALVQAGIVDPFCGPAPRLEWDSRRGKLSLQPSTFPGPTHDLAVVVNARLAPTNVATTASPLVRSLLAGGHIVAYANALGGSVYRPGGIAVTDTYRVIDRLAHTHANFFAVGAITEGCTWYSQVLARPYVNSRSMRDAACVAHALWDYFAHRGAVRVDAVGVNGHKLHDRNHAHAVEPETMEANPALAVSRNGVP